MKFADIPAIIIVLKRFIYLKYLKNIRNIVKMENDFEGNVRGIGYDKDNIFNKLENSNRNFEANDWKNKSNKSLESHHIPMQVIDNSKLTILKIFAILGIISLMASAVFFLILVKDGKFQSNLNQSINTQVNNTVNNQYDFSPLTSNQYSFNINATVIIQNLTVKTNST